jgi:monoamine oxidase
VDAYQISFLYFLFYMRSGVNFEILGGYENAAQAWTVKGTLHQVAQRIVEELRDSVVLEAPVRAISQEANSVVVKSDKGVWGGNYAIVAVPLPLSVRIAYQPELPSDPRHSGAAYANRFGLRRCEHSRHKLEEKSFFCRLRLPVK